MSPTVANFLFETVNFLLLAAALGWVLWRPLRAALDREQAERARLAEEDGRVRREAAALTATATNARERAEQEATSAAARVLGAARIEAAKIMDLSRAAAEEERRALARELDASRDAQAAALLERISVLAAEAVRRLLATIDGPALDLALVRAACQQLQTIPASSLAHAAVEAARPLTDESRALLRGVLGSFAERSVPALGAGVRVTFAGGQVDASAGSIAREAARALRPATSPGQAEVARG